MAQYDNRYEQNVPGRYYVDKTCVHCKLCAEIAPEHFRQSDYAGFVISQPSDSVTLSLCAQAKEDCPVSAIGDDGEL